MQLQRTISTAGLLLTSLGCMVGSGWLFGGFYAAKIAGTGAIISWMLGGAMVMFIAFAFAELSAMLPVTGGIARYSHFTHGPLVSFCMSWLAWLSCVAVAPTEVQACLQYAASYYPWLITKIDDVHVLTTGGFAVAALLLFLISFINIMGMKLLIRFNSLVTWGKFLVPIVTVLIIMSHRFETSNFNGLDLSSGGWHNIVWALPTAGIIFSFLGFREATSLAGEAKRPHIALPVAVIGSVLFCTVLYVFIQIGFIGALSKEALTNGWSALSFAGDAGPFAGIAMSLGLGSLVLIIYADALVSPLGTATIYTTTTSRLNYAMSYNHYAPSFMLKLNQKGVPGRAIWVNFIVGILLFFPLPSWQALVGFQSISIVLAYGVGPIALLCLRKQLPDIKRPFTLPARHLLCFLTFYFCNLIAYWTGWQTIWRLGIAIMLGFVLLYGYRSVQQESQRHALNWKNAWWVIPYFAGLSLISYLGNFDGGIEVLSFGWDFAVLFVFSLFILVCAYNSRNSAEFAKQHLYNDKELQLFFDE